MRLNFKNNAYATLKNSINSSATSLVVNDATLLPDVPFLLTILDSDKKTGVPVEIIEVGAKSSTTLSSILRGREGTTAQSHSAGVRLENRFTAGAVGEIPYTKADISLGNVDNVQQATKTEFDTHTGSDTAHGATSAATASKIIIRDAYGRAKVVAPFEDDDIARKDTVDNAVALVLGDDNTDVSALFAVLHERHTRSTVLTYTSGLLTKVEEKNEDSVIKTINLGYTNGILTTVGEIAGGVTAVTTLTYTNGDLTGMTRVVS